MGAAGVARRPNVAQRGLQRSVVKLICFTVSSSAAAPGFVPVRGLFTMCMMCTGFGGCALRDVLAYV